MQNYLFLGGFNNPSTKIYEHKNCTKLKFNKRKKFATKMYYETAFTFNSF